MEGEANSSHSGFLKFVTARSLQQGSLQIPKSFVDHHESCFHKHVCLEVPTGAIWKVELQRSEGRVCLGKGFLEFANCNSIKEGYYLVFKHEEGSFLHVLIFTNTGFEIKYPSASAFPTPKVTEIEDEDEDTDVSSDDYCRECPRKSSHKTRSTEPLVNRSGKRQVGENGTKRKLSHKIRSTEPLVNRSGKRQVGESGTKKTVPISASLKQKLNCARFKRKVLEKSGIFESEEPHFILFINPSHISQSNIMRIPAAHFKRYLKKDYNRHGQNDMVLHGSKGRSWRVQFTVSDMNPNDAAFSHGWRVFVEENELEEGDVCMFEMMNSKIKEYKVTTYSLGDHP